MNGYYLAAAVAASCLGVAHSILGEMFIFRKLKAERPTLSRRHIAALWSTWHLATLFGWGIAGIFLWLANPTRDAAVLGIWIAALFCLCAVFWLFGTRGRHPAWIVFLAIAALSYLGSA